MREGCEVQGKNIVKNRWESLQNGNLKNQEGKDALTLICNLFLTDCTLKEGNLIKVKIVKANANENPKYRLNEAELVGQISNLLVAGHQTSAHSIGWVLYELSRNIEIQEKLRKEIRKAREMNGEVTLDAEILENLPYLNAVLKVGFSRLLSFL